MFSRLPTLTEFRKRNLLGNVALYKPCTVTFFFYDATLVLLQTLFRYYEQFCRGHVVPMRISFRYEPYPVVNPAPISCTNTGLFSTKVLN
jgi:hypothetical protein